MMKHTLFSALLAIAFVAAGCSSEGAESGNDAPLNEAEQNMADSIAFMEEMAAKSGVQQTESGLLYEVLVEGEGEKPNATSRVTVHYEGTFPNGDVFDSSYARGETISFGLNQVISGWTEGVQLMSPGAKYNFYIPSNLAYGPRGRPGIPPNQALKFTIELFSF